MQRQEKRNAIKWQQQQWQGLDDPGSNRRSTKRQEFSCEELNQRPLSSLLQIVQKPLNLLLTSHPDALCPRSRSERLPSEPLVAAEAAAAHHHWPRFGLDDTRQLHTCSPVTPTTMSRTQISQIPKHKHKNIQIPTRK